MMKKYRKRAEVDAYGKPKTYNHWKLSSVWMWAEIILNEWKWLLELLRVKVLVVDKQLLTTLRFPGNIYTNVTIKNKLFKIGRNSFSFINLMTNKTKYNLGAFARWRLRDTCKPLNSV